MSKFTRPLCRNKTNKTLKISGFNQQESKFLTFKLSFFDRKAPLRHGACIDLAKRNGQKNSNIKTHEERPQSFQLSYIKQDSNVVNISALMDREKDGSDAVRSSSHCLPPRGCPALPPGHHHHHRHHHLVIIISLDVVIFFIIIIIKCLQSQPIRGAIKKKKF